MSVCRNAYVFLPCHRIGIEQPLFVCLSCHVQHGIFLGNVPSLVLRHDFVFSRRNIRQAKFPVLVCHGVVGMIDDQHDSVHLL